MKSKLPIILRPKVFPTLPHMLACNCNGYLMIPIYHKNKIPTSLLKSDKEPTKTHPVLFDITQ